MIYGHLEEAETYERLTRHRVWNQAFGWIKAMPAQPEKGIHPIIEELMYANIMAYDTVAREAARYESHRNHIDLQFTISGAEIIDWCLARELAKDGEFSEEKDLQFYLPQETRTCVHMRPGHFGIFYPQDAHRPKVSDGELAHVYKGVIKINRSLLRDE